MADRMPMESGFNDELVVAPSTRTLVDDQATMLSNKVGTNTSSETRDVVGNDDVVVVVV